ncbi:MAG: hypothetical protein D8M58_17200 [Calditrichaeota bacterium]|nr:MAG: hypothetical protein DWQ03_12330 [Calditrichota bacterium]MBL1207145.1 hypothetical protein [Calditrichota bacterium]NOG46975.1 hypothetical protein [Calditrichota bacterium]
MDYFENIIKRVVEEDGYWVRQSFKVNLTKKEKRAIGKPTIPRPEIDIVGYRANTNELLVLEVKSFLDSVGVRFKELAENFEIPTGRYKMFTCKKYREVVFKRLVSDLVEKQLILPEPKLSFGLAAGNIFIKEQEQLKTFFKAKSWVLYTPQMITKAIEKLAHIPYENDPYVISSKIMMKNKLGKRYSKLGKRI